MSPIVDFQSFVYVVSRVLYRFHKINDLIKVCHEFIQISLDVI